MFGSKHPAEATPPAETPDTPPLQRVEPKDARCMRPSSFATRRDAADRDNRSRAVPRIASLGMSDYRQRTRGGDIEVIEVEQFVDVDRPGRRYVAFPGFQMTRTNDDRRADDVTTLGAVTNPRRPLGRPQGSRDPSPPDPASRPVA